MSRIFWESLAFFSIIGISTLLFAFWATSPPPAAEFLQLHNMDIIYSINSNGITHPMSKRGRSWSNITYYGPTTSRTEILRSSMVQKTSAGGVDEVIYSTLWFPSTTATFSLLAKTSTHLAKQSSVALQTSVAVNPLFTTTRQISESLPNESATPTVYTLPNLPFKQSTLIASVSSESTNTPQELASTAIYSSSILLPTSTSITTASLSSGGIYLASPPESTLSTVYNAVQFAEVPKATISHLSGTDLSTQTLLSSADGTSTASTLAAYIPPATELIPPLISSSPTTTTSDVPPLTESSLPLESRLSTTAAASPIPTSSPSTLSTISSNHSTSHHTSLAAVSTTPTSTPTTLTVKTSTNSLHTAGTIIALTLGLLLTLTILLALLLLIRRQILRGINTPSTKPPPTPPPTPPQPITSTTLTVRGIDKCRAKPLSEQNPCTLLKRKLSAADPTYNYGINFPLTDGGRSGVGEWSERLVGRGASPVSSLSRSSTEQTFGTAMERFASASAGFGRVRMGTVSVFTPTVTTFEEGGAGCARSARSFRGVVVEGDIFEMESGSGEGGEEGRGRNERDERDERQEQGGWNAESLDGK